MNKNRREYMREYMRKYKGHKQGHKKEIIKVCECCHNEFKTSNATKKACSNACRVKKQYIKRLKKTVPDFKALFGIAFYTELKRILGRKQGFKTQSQVIQNLSRIKTKAYWDNELKLTINYHLQGLPEYFKEREDFVICKSLRNVMA